MKSALITGIGGQDGAYLAKLLLDKGYTIYGFNKQRTPLHNLKKLNIENDVKIIDGDVTDVFSVAEALKVSEPDEIYNLAAQSHVGYSFKIPQHTCSINYMGFLNVLLEARKYVPRAKIYQAGTSEMFGYAAEMLQDENTPFQPKSPYAISKVAAHWAGVNARHECDQFVCNGILFNHESPLRHPDFVTKKIADGVNRITNEMVVSGINNITPIKLGNIDSQRDWGFAGDYVEAMWRMMQLPKPDDFVIATGETHSVREFINEAFNVSGRKIEWKFSGKNEKAYLYDKCVVEIDPMFYRPNELGFLRGSYTKAKHILGWEPKVGFKQLVNMMVTQ